MNEKNSTGICNVCKYAKEVQSFDECYNCVGYFSNFEPSSALKMAMNNKRDSPLIILGFPGIGKTYLKEKYKGSSVRVVDSDSSEFDKRDFPSNYIQHINKLINQGVNVILISTHEAVRKKILEDGFSDNCQVVIVYPTLESKQYYLQRYKDRGNSEQFVNLIDNNWEKWITDIQNEDWAYRIELYAREVNGKIEFDNLSNHTYKFKQFDK